MDGLHLPLVPRWRLALRGARLALMPLTQSIQDWLKEQEAQRNPGASLDKAEEPWPISPVAPISDRCREAFRNLGIFDD